MKIEPAALAQYIDHTLLAADATREQIATLCREAQEHGFYSVCVNSGQVPYAASLLTDGQVKVCAVVGFPLGAGLSDTKAFEARQAIAAGAGEIDMVLNVGALKDGLLDRVSDDIAAVKQACGDVPLKVILETCLLDDAVDADGRREVCRSNTAVVDLLLAQPASAHGRAGHHDDRRRAGRTRGHRRR